MTTITNPTIQDLERQVRTDLENAMGITNVLQKRYINAHAGAEAAQLKLLYLAIAKVQKNVFPDRAETESAGGTLERFGRGYLNRNRFAATQGEYNVKFTGETGVVISTGLVVFNPLTSEQYATTADGTIVAGEVTIAVRSIASGSATALVQDNELTLTSTLAGVDPTATVVDAILDPTDEESIETYRSAILDAIILEPQGGAAADYRLWARDAQGAYATYPFPGSQASTIVIYIEEDNDTRVPTATTIQNVQNVIEMDPDTTKPLAERFRKPMTVWLAEYLPITTLTVDVTITGSTSTDPTLEATILSVIEAHLLTVRPYVGGADDPSNYLDTLRITDLTTVVFNALPSGVSFQTLELEVDGASTSGYTFTNGDIPLLNNLVIS